MSSRMRQKSQNVLDKRIPQNPKYKHVKSTIDTGSSITKYMQKIEDIKTNYKFRKDEIFRRIKLTTFVQLVIQVYQQNYAESLDFGNSVTPSQLDALDEDGELSTLNGNGGSPVPSLAVTEGDYGAPSSSRLDTSRSTLIDVAKGQGELGFPESPLPMIRYKKVDPHCVYKTVAQGIGEMDLSAPPPAPSNTFVNGSSPYLLLDVRDSDEYELCHILSGLNYPKANLARTANYETKEMLSYKNIPGKIIIVYDEDERVAPLVATTLVERKYENLFMLSGGLKLAYKKFPEGLLTGTPSPAITGKPPSKSPVVPANSKTFTDDDMDRIQIYLDNALQDHSIGSRLSQASTASSRVSKGSSRMSGAMSVTSSLVSEDRPPFK